MCHLASACHTTRRSSPAALRLMYVRHPAIGQATIRSHTRHVHTSGHRSAIRDLLVGIVSCAHCVPFW